VKKITVYEDEVTKELKDLFGIFFEDINHAADGGLYAELVQNRSFEFAPIDNKEYNSLTAWEKSDNAKWSVECESPLNEENTHYLCAGGGADDYIRNLGFNTGIYIEKDKQYVFSVYAALASDNAEACADDIDKKGIPDAEKAKLIIAVKDDEGNVFAKSKVVVDSYGWKKYDAVLTACESTQKGRLYIIFTGNAYVKLDMISLFPKDTFKNRKNGLRRDIAEALADMKPRFMRFPGGCLTHDGSLDDHARNSMYRWKRTIGDVEKRPAWRNNWGYNQTLGLGYYEYFCFCEDIGAKPLPVLPGGFNPHKGEGVPIEEIGAWVDDALDLIEFANGDATTKWGSIRAGLGHEKPFGLEYIGIGNEEIGEGFFERYPYFHKAIRKKYPSIRIINTAGPFAVGEGYDAGWTSAKKYASDFIDEHYYSSPEWFMANMHHYDDYDASGTKVFLGEYATWGNTYYNALVEAAYMTHLEKAPVVGLACYAPMLANKDYVNWRPDMLFFDNHQVMKTANYHVQKLFMKNQGDYELKIKLEGFDEIIPLMDERNIAGSITLVGNDIVGKVWDVKLTDKETNACTLIEPFDITKESKDDIIKDIDSTHYELEFKFRRSEGRKGFKLLFGKCDEKNYIMWEFGGWDNWDCNISSFKNGRASTISHRIFHVTDEEYTLRLEIEGRRIRTYVDGILYNDTVDRLPQLEEIYVCASKDMNGRTIVKAVNLTGEEKNTVISIAGAYKSRLTVYQLSDCALTEENTFEQPDTIEPKKSVYQVENNEYQYIVKPHSVNILVFE
jgi:alpha-L-arabinofuranosidase